MKKVCFSLVLSLFLSFIPSQKSEAFVGIVALNPGMAILGAAYTVVPTVAFSLRPCHQFCSYTSIMIIGMGLVILDSAKNPMAFSELLDGSETKLKISNEDRMTFNSELDEAQAIGQSLAQDLVKTYGSQSNVDYKKVAKVADQKWNQICAQGQLSAGTCRAIHAIRNQELKK